MIDSPKEIAYHYIELGKKKASMPLGQMISLAFLAGMFIALGAVGANTASCTMPNPSAAKIAAGVVFPAGLAMVLIAGAELFTGNCLISISVLEGKVSPWHMVRNWLMVYGGNFLGAIFIAWAVNAGGQLQLFSGDLAVYTVKIASGKCNIPFFQAFLLGVLCNILVCIAVWINFAGKTVVDKICGLFLPVMLFVISGYEHSIANMYYIPAGLLAVQDPATKAAAVAKGISVETLTWDGFFVHNLVPTTLGNIVGGAIVVGGIYWFAYIRQDKKVGV